MQFHCLRQSETTAPCPQAILESRWSFIGVNFEFLYLSVCEFHFVVVGVCEFTHLDRILSDSASPVSKSQLCVCL